jgi:hypothetical protein
MLQLPADGKDYTCANGALVAPLSQDNITLQSSSTFDAPLKIPPTYPLRLTS